MDINEIVKKEIDYQINAKNNAWTALIVTIGATISLMFNVDSILKIFFIFIGIFFSYCFLIKYIKTDKRLELLLYKINKGVDL